MKNFETIYLGAGCFWCSEAAFKRIKGVVKVTPGYSGGAFENPTYKDVCTGKTGHAEVAEIVFDPKLVSIKKLLDIFFTVHDPTTLNRQGGDAGTQYRSIILYASASQKKAAVEYIKSAKKDFKDKIVTEIKKLEKFWPAEDYHHDYFTKNPLQPYCLFVVRKKVRKIEEKFKEDLKK